MKIVVPENVSSCFVDGKSIAVKPGDVLDVEPSIAAVLDSHGFAAQDEESISPALPDFDEMDRSALFAFLKERGVACGPGTGTDTLRDLCRKTVAA